MIPADIFHSRRTPERMQALVQSAIDVHANMLRLWGGDALHALQVLFWLCIQLPFTFVHLQHRIH